MDEMERKRLQRITNKGMLKIAMEMIETAQNHIVEVSKEVESEEIAEYLDNITSTTRQALEEIERGIDMLAELYKEMK